MHFGLYLVKSQVIDCEQFVTALELQLASRLQLGGLALETGKMTVKQVFKVLRLQCGTPAGLFGEIAVDQGFLNESDLSSLLVMQSVRQRSMAEIVIEHQFASKEEVLRYLESYRQGQQTYLGNAVLN